MAKYLSNIDLVQNQLIRARLDNQSADPSGAAGQVYYNTVSGILKYYDGTGTPQWRVLAASGAAVTSVTATAPLTANAVSGSAQVGAITVAIPAASASTAGSFSITNFNTLNAATSTNTLSTLALRDGSGNFAANVITVVGVTISGTTTNATDAATKSYVDSVATGLDVKASVRVATVGSNLVVTYANGTSGVGATLTATPNGAIVIDGVSLILTDRVLVKDQTSAFQNGIYTVTQVGSAGSPFILTRATDTNSTNNILEGIFTYTGEGTLNVGAGFVLVNTGGAVTVGTTNLTFSQFSGAGSIIAGSGLQKSGNSLSILVDPASTQGSNILTTSGSGLKLTTTNITGLGTLTTGTWQATTVGTIYGGTGLTSFAGAGALIYATGTTALTSLTGNATATKQFLSMSSSTPAWGVLVNVDIPVFTGANGSVGGTLGGVPVTAATDNVKFLRGDATWVALSSVSIVSVTIGSTNGGNTLLQATTTAGATVIDFVTTPTGNTILASPAGGGAGAPLFRSLVNADLPIVGVPKGGTGLSTITTNGIIYGQAAATVAVTAAGTQYQVFQAGASGVPVFGAVNLAQAAAVTGSLPLTNGGTNATTASGARTQLASDVAGGVIPVKVALTLTANSATTAFTVSHNLASRDIVSSLASNLTPWDVQYADVTFPTVNSATITFAVAPTTGNDFRITLIG